MNSTKTKSRQPKLNVQLLRRIKRHILEEPRRFFMQGVVQTGEPGKPFEKQLAYGDLASLVPPCGTAACIHGWTALLSGKTPKQTGRLSFEWSERRLGIPHDNRISQFWGKDYLFDADDWPQPFASRYAKAITPRGRAKIAAARIEHLITTGE